MARITCEIPSTGKPTTYAIVNIGTAFVTLAEVPDYSVPDLANQFAVRDPTDSSRAIRPGEVFFGIPLLVRNKTVDTRWVEFRLLLENGATVAVPGRFSVPALDTIQVPMQGISLLKRTAPTADGDRLQVRAEVVNALDVFGMGEERPSSEHLGVA